jgi:hypothetical protein
MKTLPATLVLGFALAMTGYGATTHAQGAPQAVQVADQGGLGDTLDGILDCLGIG